MQKIFFSILILFFLTIGAGALAQDNSLPSSGITPDSPFYFLKSWKESIQTFFTFSEENKAKQFLHLADVRLAEYQKMIEKGKTEIAEKTLKKYEDQLQRALEKTEQAKEKGQDVEELATSISERVLKHQEVLAEVLEKVPEQAKKGIENAIEMSRKGFESAIQAVSGEKKEELQKKAEEIKNIIKEKIEAKSTALENKLQQELKEKSLENLKSSVPSAETPKPSPASTPSEPAPSEIRYYTCPDGTKVESGKCYGTGETLRCALKVSPELQCSAPTPTVTPVQPEVVACCSTAGLCKMETKEQCLVKNATASGPSCSPNPCSQPTPVYNECKQGPMKDYKCPSGTLVKWKCECTAHADGEETRLCSVKPAPSCPGLGSATSLTITEITVRHLLWMTKEWTIVDHIFWATNQPANSYIEYGPTTSYGFTAGYTASPSTPTTEHGTDGLPELQRNTSYHFRIIAEDTKGNKIVSDDYTFTTGL